jgi:branched-subunit amino acid ABC-type transport system permease component
VSAYVAGYLVNDGIANGAIYSLLAIALVVIFAVTRIIFIPQGEFVSYSALTYVAMLEGRVSGVILFVLILSIAAGVVEFVRGAMRGRASESLRAAIRRTLPPLGACALAYAASVIDMAPLARLAATVILMTAFGPVLYRLIYAPIASASSLVLLIVSVAAHLSLLGMGLYFFGPQGGHAPPLIDAVALIGGIPVPAQSILIVITACVLMLALYGLAERTLYGKAMRAAAFNPVGARLMGVSSSLAGETAFALAAFIGALSGTLVCALTTVYYDTGFLLGLKGFVAAIFGALVNFPLAVLGALAIGMLESFSSFFASAFKEVLVFSLIIPALLWRSLAAQRAREEDE